MSVGVGGVGWCVSKRVYAVVKYSVGGDWEKKKTREVMYRQQINECNPYVLQCLPVFIALLWMSHAGQNHTLQIYRVGLMWCLLLQ